MDHIECQPHPPNTACEQTKAILSKLHCKGFVFGDLRHQNILFVDDKFILIDFNWCGQYDMGIRNDGLPEGLQQWTHENADNVEPGSEDRTYARYPLSMSTAGGVWSAAM
jgi:serine/threonine protein kinase